MSMSCPAVVRVIDQFAPPLRALTERSPEELDRLGEAFAALAEVTSGSVSTQWRRGSERCHAEAMMRRAEIAAEAAVSKSSSVA